MFRGRLVDAIDAVLDLLDADPGFRFVLDGQAIVLDDYLEVRPDRREALAAGRARGPPRGGPWYVQPDSLLPAGETHVRNLLHRARSRGRASARSSRVAYVPDSFGHPAQFPQLLAGFGLDPFVYWRGNGAELDTLAPLYRWRAPDGSVGARLASRRGLLRRGRPRRRRRRRRHRRSASAGRSTGWRRAASDRVLLMNGFDHLPADTSTGHVADAARRAARAARRRGRALAAGRSTLAEWSGALVGARIANLLPGVWSARMPLKLRNRAVETLLTAWAEPWAAFGRALGLADERPALDHGVAGAAAATRRTTRSAAARSIPCTSAWSRATTTPKASAAPRCSACSNGSRAANVTRDTPWRDEQDVVVFNASAEPRTDVVRVPLEGVPAVARRA